MPNDAIHALETRLRQLPPEEQRRTALELATLVLPLVQLSEEGQPAGGLASVAEAIRAGAGISEVDNARHALLAMPELATDEEPTGLAWFTFGASVAWIYAADAHTTAPSDGVVNTFTRVCDLLDAIDSDLGDTRLLDQLLKASSAFGTDAMSLSELAEAVRAAVDRLGPY